MRKSFSQVLALFCIIAISLLTYPQIVQSEALEDFRYEDFLCHADYCTGEITIIQYIGTNLSINVPDKINDLNVTAIGDSSFGSFLDRCGWLKKGGDGQYSL